MIIFKVIILITANPHQQLGPQMGGLQSWVWGSPQW